MQPVTSEKTPTVGWWLMVKDNLPWWVDGRTASHSQISPKTCSSWMLPRGVLPPTPEKKGATKAWYPSPPPLAVGRLAENRRCLHHSYLACQRFASWNCHAFLSWYCPNMPPMLEEKPSKKQEQVNFWPKFLRALARTMFLRDSSVNHWTRSKVGCDVVSMGCRATNHPVLMQGLQPSCSLPSIFLSNDHLLRSKEDRIFVTSWNGSWEKLAKIHPSRC